MTEPTAAPRVPASARERARAEVMSELLAAARARLEADGSAGLSLRAVARDLGMASSAVYRYVESRDALLTLLIIEAYDSVGSAAEEAAVRARDGGADPARTWLEVARSVRRWALAQPSWFELIYGTPVRGYRAPDDTVRAALRLWGVIVGLLVAAEESGQLDPAGPPFDPEGRIAPEVYAFAGWTDPSAVPAGASPDGSALRHVVHVARRRDLRGALRPPVPRGRRRGAAVRRHHRDRGGRRGAARRAD